MKGFKNDTEARNHWGSAYDAIPKSAFALIAYHLANLCAEEPDIHASIMNRIVEECDTLAANGIMMQRHANTVRKAVG